ncbi:MAG: hypothetical protein KF819_26725 [Labilithrix sp.]|nr:hypothetical protein [Labilithrix sp.]
MRSITWLGRARLWLVVAFTYAYFFSGGDPNQATRFALTEALVERRAPDITPVHYRTIDKGYKNDRFYADKAPGVSLLSVVPFAIMRGADAVFRIDPRSRDTQNAKLYFLSLIFSAAAGVGCVLLLRRLARFLGCSERAAEVTALAYAFGTLAFPFSTVLFGHQFAALLLLGAFVLALEAREKEELESPRTLATLGALWSLSIVVEYPTALLVTAFGTGLLAWTFDRARPLKSLGRTLLWAGVGGAPVLIVHAAFLIWAYGKFALPYVYVSEPYFKAHMSGGILGIGMPSRVATYGTLVGAYRGILFYCPVLALSVAGVGAWIASKRDARPLRVMLPALGLYLLFAFSYYAWDGGGSVGPRHLVPALPYFMLPIAFFADRSRWAMGLTILLGIVSSGIMLAATFVLVQLPQGDPYSMSPLYDLILPTIARGGGAINAQDSFIPFMRADAAFNWGKLFGLSTRASLFVVPMVWLAAYAPDLLRSLRRTPAHA